MAEYNVLSASTLSGKARLVKHESEQNPEVLLSAPAMTVMTDLSRVPVASVLPEASIDEANDLMVQRRVRMLFVLDDNGHMIGLVTTNDILGEKPMQVVLQRGSRHDEIRVQDVMTSVDHVEALDQADVEEACVGDIVETMRDRGRQHAIVTCRSDGGEIEVCGVFSAADLSRRLGREVVPLVLARTFAEIEETIARE